MTSLLLSPRSKGLYRSAIAQSGVTQSAWSATDKHPAYYARSLAQEVGCDGDATLLEIKSCLTKVRIQITIFSAPPYSTPAAYFLIFF